MLVIPIQPVPAQQVSAVLANQNCQLNIYLRGTKIYVDLNSNGTDMCNAALAHNAVPLDACNSYDGFQGNFYFIDTQGNEDPQYTGFNSRWFLVYLTAAEVLLTEQQGSSVLQLELMTLAATLEATSSGPGPFSIAHHLGLTPILIEIIPTSPGSIWADPDFADDTDIYLNASDAGQTANILVYLPAVAGLSFITPAKILNITSPAQPPDTFSIAHGLGFVPTLLEILPSSPGKIWQTAPPDGTNLHLAASAPNLTAVISLYGPFLSALNLLAPARIISQVAPNDGNFTIQHGLNATPSRVEVVRISPGSMWAQSPAFDASNVYLAASEAGVTALILIFA